jgi:hypothetical protein
MMEAGGVSITEAASRFALSEDPQPTRIIEAATRGMLSKRGIVTNMSGSPLRGLVGMASIDWEWS